MLPAGRFDCLARCVGLPTVRGTTALLLVGTAELLLVGTTELLLVCTALLLLVDTADRSVAMHIGSKHQAFPAVCKSLCDR